MGCVCFSVPGPHKSLLLLTHTHSLSPQSRHFLPLMWGEEDEYDKDGVHICRYDDAVHGAHMNDGALDVDMSGMSARERASLFGVLAVDRDIVIIGCLLLAGAATRSPPWYGARLAVGEEDAYAHVLVRLCCVARAWRGRRVLSRMRSACRRAFCEAVPYDTVVDVFAPDAHVSEEVLAHYGYERLDDGVFTEAVYRAHAPVQSPERRVRFVPMYHDVET